ncbi:MAG: ABC transporter permease [Eubacterium sp.]|nr:ABC transporter permease [Eubacterium sp.]
MKNKIDAFLCEYTLCVKRQLRYKMSWVSDIILFTIVFYAIFILFGSEDATTQQTINTFIGYIYWQISSICLGISASAVREDAMIGMLEMKIMSKVPMTVLLFAKLMASLLAEITSIVAVTVIAAFFWSYGAAEIFQILCSLLIYLPSLFGMFGFGLIFGGLALKEKNLGQLIFLVQILLLFCSSVFHESFPALSFVIPYAYGIDIARMWINTGLLSSYSILIYLGVNCVWFIVGKLFFEKLLEKNKREGWFSSY